MAAPFRNPEIDLAAPTPQNTPSNAAPISSRAQQPGVASITEVDERAAAVGFMTQNPVVVRMMQDKLNKLIGRSSGYIESLPLAVRRRVAGLNGIQKEHTKLEAEFQEEVLELEKKYFKRFTPLYEKRTKVVNGDVEPTEDEVKAGVPEGDEQPSFDVEKPIEGEESKPPMKGIPEFWLSAMKNLTALEELIKESDQPALKSLVDIRMEYLDKPGFRLIFEFANNEFFKNTTLTKTYYYREENGYGGDFIYDRAEGCKVEWNTGKDLTVRVESKKQRNKNTKQTRIVKKTVPCDSFFNFFSPPAPPAEDDEDAASDIEDRLELDYQIGEDIKEKLIPRAIDWFTGAALLHEAAFPFDDEDELDFDDEDDEDSEDRDDDEDEESDEEGDGEKPKQEAAECKQS